MFRHRGDDSAAVFSILLVLLCAFHDPESASFCRQDMCGAAEQEKTGVAVIVVVVDSTKGSRTRHPNDIESLEQKPALDRRQVESPPQLDCSVGSRLEVTRGR